MCLFQQDNVCTHTSRFSQRALEGVRQLPWPARIPDLSSIEHVWEMMGRCLARSAIPATNLRQLQQQRLDCSPPTKANRVLYPARPLCIFASGNRAGRCRWSACFLGYLPFLPPLHSGTTPHLIPPSQDLVIVPPHKGSAMVEHHTVHLTIQDEDLHQLSCRYVLNLKPCDRLPRVRYCERFQYGHGLQLPSPKKPILNCSTPLLLYDGFYSPLEPTSLLAHRIYTNSNAPTSTHRFPEIVPLRSLYRASDLFNSTLREFLNHSQTSRLTTPRISRPLLPVTHSRLARSSPNKRWADYSFSCDTSIDIVSSRNARGVNVCCYPLHSSLWPLRVEPGHHTGVMPECVIERSEVTTLHGLLACATHTNSKFLGTCARQQGLGRRPENVLEVPLLALEIRGIQSTGSSVARTQEAGERGWWLELR
ncbi:hypothetical protein PR048_002867 [Dryococelus australis]|uniref:Uncharacterized protein n=1 Tax=Dryococelus australis TaxID=614101 RepID=A0ABQ9IMW7_9NEOP|nr:hypothetical protein PR048_002867 [Dryococelus australis]